MRRKLFAISLAALLLLAGCGGCGTASDKAMMGGGMPSASGAPMSPDMEDNYWDMGMGGGEADFAPAPAPTSGESQGSSIYQNPGAKLIRRAELSIQTEKFDESKAALDRLVAECGGYFENSSEYGGGYRDAYANRSGEYTVRVPAEKYDRFLSQTGELGYVTNKDESSEDVGERYYDIEARLKTQRTKQERLLVLLEKAETMEDIISLENALSDVEYQIEMYSSDLRRYDALVGFSTFQISLSEVRQVTEEVGETASLGQRMSAGFQASVRGLSQGFQNFLIWVSYNLFLAVFLTAVAAVAVIVGRRELKKLRKQDEKRTEED